MPLMVSPALTRWEIARPDTGAGVVFAQTVGQAAGWPGTDLTVTVLNALGLLVGALIGASTAKAKLTA